MKDYLKPTVNKPTKLPPPPPSPAGWADIQKAVVNLDKKKIKKYGQELGKDALIQPGISVAEVQHQILSMAPGKHPMLGPLLLDLAGKL
jgi:hypothetical protein